jgi:hypothetical protein
VQRIVYKLSLTLVCLSWQGIPENVEAPPVARAPAAGQQTNQQAPSPAQPAAAPPVQSSAASARPNANPLNLFPQVCAVKVGMDMKCLDLFFTM